MEDEIFGPLLPILTYKDMDAAIREVKKHSEASFRLPLQPRSAGDRSTSSQACPSAAARSIR